ncbi:MAG: ABC transporter substrate-binding protein [Butyrivibrio sp.]|nr:ABC transporter substrate-binding protein [Butyrivibrio sp.]
MSKTKFKAAAFAAVLALSAGMPKYAESVAAAEKELVLRVCSWEEYIDEGGWSGEQLIELESADIFGENNMIKDFEDWYLENYGVRVRVEYSTFGTNEEMYSQLTLGSMYDLVCPSDYMIMKLMSEDMLEPLSDGFFDKSKEDNYYFRGVSPYIEGIFEENKINGEPWSRYAAGYMWGITGVLYNPEYVDSEDASTWSILANDKYFRQVTIKDNVRDAYFPTLAILNADKLTDADFTAAPDYREKLALIMNDTDSATVEMAEQKLKEIRANVYSFETDSGKSDMVSGKVVANLQWSGDAVYAMDQAEEDGLELCWAVPEECTNLWFDGWVMLKNGINGSAEKKRAAEAFINFMSRPDNAVRNMNYIGYTSAIAGGDSPIVYEYLEWCYKAEEDEEDTAEYPVGYFFSGDSDDPRYVVTVPAEQANRQLSAQYPSEEQIAKSAVMWYFDDKANEEINRMWINIRCFDMRTVSGRSWLIAGASAAAAALFALVLVFRHKIFRRPVPRGYKRAD